MLADTTAFSSFAVDDLTAATRFYRETLGLRTTNHSPEMPLLTLHLPGDQDTMVYEKPDTSRRPTPSSTSRSATSTPPSTGWSGEVSRWSATTTSTRTRRASPATRAARRSPGSRTRPATSSPC